MKVFVIEGYSVDNSLVCLELFKNYEKAESAVNKYEGENSDVTYVMRHIEVQE